MENIVPFHFHLTNIILLLMNEGEFYCFCNKVKKRCTLCKMHYDFSRDKNGEERLEGFKHKLDGLKKLLTKCGHI